MKNHKDIYGCEVSALHTYVRDYIGEGKLFTSRKRAAFSLLSLAQEEIHNGDCRRAHRTLNRVKWLLAGGDRRNEDTGNADLAGIERRG